MKPPFRMQTLTIPASIAKRKQACRSCRQRKKKCDAERPTCSMCIKLGLICEYTIATAPHNDSPAVYSSALGAPPVTQAIAPFGLDLEQSGSLDFMQLPGLNFDLATPTQINYPPPESSQYLNTGVDQQDVIADFHLPPHDLLTELVELFFDHLYHMFPCFHHNSFKKQLQDGVLQKQSPLILYAMSCVAARYHPDVSVKKREKDWYEQAKFNYELTQRNPYPSLRTIQAVLVLILHAYTIGDFSSSWLFLGKAWRQAVALGMNRMDASNAMDMGGNPQNATAGDDRYYDFEKREGITAVEKEEYRQTLWLMFITDRNHAWPTGWPNAIPELYFKVDIPISDAIFQAMDPGFESSPYENTPFTRNLERLIGSSASAKQPLNVLHYICVVHVLLGRVSELVQSLHHVPDTTEYAEECAELNSHIVKFQLGLPHQITSVLEASPAERAHVVWLQVMLNTCAMILHYRCSSGTTEIDTPPPFVLALTAARNTAQIIKDASRISIDLLMSAHIGSSLYIAARILIIEWRMTGDPSLRDELDLFESVFDRMNEVFLFLGMKFKFPLEHDMRKSLEELKQLRQSGFRGLLADCSKWTHVKEEVQLRGLIIDIT